MRHRFLWVALSSVLICAHPLVAQTRAHRHQNMQPSEQRSKSAEGNAVPPEYDSTIRLFPDRSRLEGSAIIRIPAAPAERGSLAFSLRQDMPSPRVEIVEPKVAAGAAELTDGGDDKDLLVTRRWVVTPHRPFPKNETIVLKVTYSGGSTAAGGGYFNQRAGRSAAVQGSHT